MLPRHRGGGDGDGGGRGKSVKTEKKTPIGYRFFWFHAASLSTKIRRFF